ncbi:MAG: D-alanine--D-alanine ligase [Planctomycetaceae bacterium]|nr:D-alanine--D-alanine ligase [Planctomycetaceae bacterium]
MPLVAFSVPALSDFASPVHIGLTFDLRQEYLAAGFSDDETAEFDRISTVEALEQALAHLGHTTDRIGHVHQLVRRLAVGDEWDLVFNIAEGLEGIAREAQVPALLDAYGIAYTFSDPLVLALTLHKGLTKTVVRAGGVPTPAFALVHKQQDLQHIDLPFPLFAKPVAEGTGKGITSASKINDAGALQSVVGNLLEEYDQPVLVETYLPGREFTVGILGSGQSARVVATLEIQLLAGAEAGAYSYVNKERCEDLVEYHLGRAEGDAQVAAAERVALDAWRILGCRDGGRVDLRCDAEGVPNFMEVNPLAGLHPEHSDLPILAAKAGVSYVELIRGILASAEPRVAIANRSKARRFRSNESCHPS